jgi:ribosome-binding factor A
MTRRTDRVNALLRQEIATLVGELHDPGISGMVTITHVDVSPDLHNASAFVSVMGSDTERAATMDALARARPFVRRELGRRLRLRHIPDVNFVADTSLEDAQRMTDIMRRNAEERGETL